jgi:DNA primase
MLADVLKQFLGDYHDHNEDTGQMSFNCPACAEDKGLEHGRGDGKFKLAVNYKKNIYRCWVCGFENNMHGKVPKLIKRYGNKKILKEYFLLRPSDEKDIKKEDLTPIEVKLPDGFIKLIKDNSSHFKFDSAYNYIKNRGITDEMIDYYNIGYTVIGKHHDRVVIPSYDEFGDLNYFIARAWDKWKKPKYLNPDAKKELIIFNENKINWDATIYLLEGVFDHLVVPNSIPLLGKTISPKLKSLLYQKAKADIIILLDDDAYDDAIRLYKDLNSGDLYNRIKLCTPPYGYDPSKIFEKLGNNGIVKLLKSSKQVRESRLY